MLEGAEGHENETKTSTQAELAHVLIDQGQTVPHRSGKRGGFTPSRREHPVGAVDAGDFHPRRRERQGNASSAAGEFEHWSAALARQALIEGNITSNLRWGVAVERIIGFHEQRAGCFVKRAHGFLQVDRRTHRSRDVAATGSQPGRLFLSSFQYRWYPRRSDLHSYR
jgi:hypothetical protein